jgi:hypothetical protein
MAKWEMFKRIVSECHRHGGVIFGGAVRDSYLHDMNERLYFEKYGHFTGNLTEFPDRFLVPNDIDCIIMSEQVEPLLKTLQHQYYVRASALTEYDGYGAGRVSGYTFRRYHLLTLLDVNHTVTIQLDLIIQQEGEQEGQQLVTPLLPFDMDVNLLLWGSRSVFVNPAARQVIRDLYELPGSGKSSMEDVLNLNAILAHILAKVAVFTPQCDSRRIRKMLKYGWTLNYRYETIVITDTLYEGVCVLCQDTIVGPHSTFVCKCAHICMSCLSTHYRALTKCTLCKKEIEPCKLQNDMRIYSVLNEPGTGIVTHES